MSIQHRVIEYYDRIDAGDIDWVVGMFAPEARYRRADADYVGRDAIEAFYRQARKITGRHTIQAPLVIGNVVVVQGAFEGQGAHDNPIKVRFCDIWEFEGEQVTQRHSYLALGSDYVRE